MKTTTNLLLLLLAFTIVIGLVGCEKEKDLTPPNVNLISPKNGDTLTAGGIMLFHALFTDDEELGEYNLDIHDNFDGHGHRGDKVPWSLNETNPITDDRHEIKREIPIPANAEPGDYHLTLRFTDKAGNAGVKDGSTAFTVEIVIVSPEEEE
jgi:hypothetical protein